MYNDNRYNLTNNYDRSIFIYEKNIKDRKYLSDKLEKYSHCEFNFKMDNHKLLISTHDGFKVFNISDFKNDDGMFSESRTNYYNIEEEKFIDLILDFNEEKLSQFVVNEDYTLRHWIEQMNENTKNKILYDLLSKNKNNFKSKEQNLLEDM